MLAKTYSCGINGLDAFKVVIEVDVSRGLPATRIVGLPDNAVKESKERVRSAIKNSGYQFSSRRVTVNLSPADIKKEGPSFDLAIALGILAATEQIDPNLLEGHILLGELSLNGDIKPVRGSLPVALYASRYNFKGLILPLANAPEASLCRQIKIYPVRSLKEVIHFLHNQQSIPAFQSRGDILLKHETSCDLDFADVKGQNHAKRGLEIAAAGGHNCLLIGPPGGGKSMLAKRLPSILPDMDLHESLETTKIHSVMGLLKSSQGIMPARPFRSPHHTTSDVAIVGGGSFPKPGEVTLSHNGVLFLDELPEFRRNVLEALRQPMEDHHVTIARANKTLCFPAKFMLVAAMNPCPCGKFMEIKRECHCSTHQIEKYLSKISGPLLDRIDIHLEVPTLPSVDLLSPTEVESSQSVKERVAKARKRQLTRLKDTPITANGYMHHKHVRTFCALSKEGKDLLKSAIEELGFSARAHDKVLKVARTIADLADEEAISPEHLAEAIQYRSLDRNWWAA